MSGRTNRFIYNSIDSQFDVVGLVDKNCDKVVWRYWPFNEWKLILIQEHLKNK